MNFRAWSVAGGRAVAASDRRGPYGKSADGQLNVCPLHRWAWKSPATSCVKRGCFSLSVRPATPDYFTRSSLVPGFQLSRFGQSPITALERDHPDRALALRRGRGEFQVVSWLLLSLLIRDGRAAERGT